jgi:O-antigen ligase
VRLSATTLGALVVGSVIAADPAGWSPFGPAKWMVISTLGCAGGALALWRRDAGLHRRTWWLWLALVVLLAVSALVNGDVRTALLGQPDRHLGAVTWLLFWLLFSAGQVLDHAGRRIVFGATIVAAGALGAYATIELIAGRPIEIATTSRRLAGSYGSAAFLGAAACLMLPVAIGYVLDPRRRMQVRAAAAGAGALAVIGLIGSGARAAWVGITTALVISIAVGTPGSVGEVTDATIGHRLRVALLARRSRALVLVAACGALAIVAVLAPRLGDVLQREHGAASRLDEWGVATRVIANHPVLGVGPEGYRIAAAEAIDTHYEQTYGRNTTLPDRAHSGPLDVALDGGIGAAVAFVALIGFVVIRCVRLMRRGRVTERWVAIGVTAYAIQQLFLFPLAEIDPVFWLLAGVVVALSRPVEPPSPSTGLGRATKAVAVLAGAAATIALIGGVLDTAANRLAKRAMQSNDAPARAIEDADRAVDLRPDVSTYRLIAADAHLRRGTLADIDAAIAGARAVLRWSPDDPFALDELGTALLQRAIVTGTDADLDASLRHWERLVGIDPRRARWQVELGRAAALSGEEATAERAWRTAMRLDPDDPSIAQLVESLSTRG